MRLIVGVIVFLLAGAGCRELDLNYLAGGFIFCSMFLLSVLICKYLGGAYSEKRDSGDYRS
jgi:hypothetical protein